MPAQAPLLLALVQPDYVVADFPAFYVIAKGTQYYADTIGKHAVRTLAVPELPDRPDDE